MPLSDNRLVTAALLLLAAVGLYGGCRAILDVLIPANGRAAGRRAIGQAVPIAAVVMAAMAAHQGALAVVIILSTSVTLLTLVLGLATLATHAPRPDGEHQVAASAGRARRTWMLVLPAALLVLVAGVRAQLGWLSATAIAALGIAILGAWRHANGVRGPRRAEKKSALPQFTQVVIVARVIQVVLGLGVCGVGAWMMLRASAAAGDQTDRLGPGTFAAVVLCPLLVLPVLGSAMSAAQHGAEIVTPLVGTVLINLCLLLPLCAVVSYGMSMSWDHQTDRAAVPADSTVAPAAILPFPPGVWRLENMLLVAIALFLLMAALRWRSLRRTEGMLLVAGYFVYLMLLMTH
jgi:Ca2+/Na+ antiporter